MLRPGRAHIDFESEPEAWRAPPEPGAHNMARPPARPWRRPCADHRDYWYRVFLCFYVIDTGSTGSLSTLHPYLTLAAAAPTSGSPPPVVPHPESHAAQAAYTEALSPGSGPNCFQALGCHGVAST